MKALINKLSLLLIALTLTSCGGGGGGGAFQAPPAVVQVSSLSVSQTSATLNTNNFADITVTAKNTDGTLAKDGTTVNAVLTPASLGIITTGGAATGTANASATTTGGIAAFRFSSGVNPGTAQLTFSTVNAGGSTISATITIAVQQGTSDSRLTLSPTTITLPANPDPASFPFLGSPYLAEVTITRRHQNGQLITGTEKDNTSIAPVQVATFSTLDDPTTAWTGETTNPQTAAGNEFLTEIGSGPVSVTGGQGTIFVHAQNVPGTATLIVTATDADSGQTVSAQLIVNVVSSIPPVPSTISLSATSSSVYVVGSGGDNGSTISALVQTATGVSVPDPVSGNTAYNNVQFDIIGANPGNAHLTTVDASGVTETGSSVKTRTTGGVAAVQFVAGTVTGPIQVKATADRLDNNVDGGIADPVSSTITINISDGKLFSLALASPVVNGLKVNSISGQVTSTSTSTSPVDPNATYSVTQSVTGIDRAGNVILPTVINFGLVDAPSSVALNFGPGNFLITGPDGDPQENGLNFSAPTGRFQTAGGGAGPGDTLLVFGHSSTFDGFIAPLGNRDLESTRTIQSIVSQTQLVVSQAFNPNDDTGVSVNNGPVIPYVIGHATAGNITASATTNAIGVATVTTTYAASHLGQFAYVWAQGTVSTATGSKTVADIAESGYPGVAPAILQAPSSIIGNAPTTITVCVTDALQQPIEQQEVDFLFEHIGNGSATIDPVGGTQTGPSTGSFASPTGKNGCVTGLVYTSGLTTGGNTTAPDLVISADGQTATVAISVGGAAVLQASPSALVDGGPVVFTLTDDHGTPISGVPISGKCTGTIAFTTIQPTSNVQGHLGTSSTTITASGLDAPVTPLTGSCTFTAADGAVATVNVTGSNLCLQNKNASGCPVPAQSTVNVSLQDATVPTAVAGSVTATGTSLGVPVSNGCTISGIASVSCPVNYDQGTTVKLTATPVHNSTFTGWAGGCTGTVAATGGVSNISLGTTAITCTANFSCTGTCP